MSRYIIRLFLVLLLLSRIFIADLSSQSFTESASSYNLDLGGNKNGGFAWADFDNDGDLDVLVNTNDNSESILYRNDGTTFTDVNTTLAPALNSYTLMRQAVWGDLNNDGYLDFLRNSNTRGEIYLQDPSTGVFGDGIGGTIPIDFSSSGTVSISDGFNSEGAGFFDFEGDGDLDIYFDNHDHGIDILRNNYINHTTGTVVDPAAASLFTHATPGTGTVLGLSQTATDGDYGASADVDDDGWVDIFMRKKDENDFFFNQGGTFVNGSNLGQADNDNKGSVGLYDLDNDGDFDAVWTDDDGNHIFRNDGSGTWTKLSGNLSIESQTDIDGVAGGDIDNDGDIDLIFSGDSKSYLYINDINNGSGVGAGTAFQMDLNTTFDGYSDNNRNGEGITMVDFDADGDLDIYINVQNNPNQLWVNDLYNTSTAPSAKKYAMIDVLENRSSRMQSSATRYALGANVVIKDCDGNILCGIRDVNGGTGHGTQNSLRVHFGLTHGYDATYIVEVNYPNDSISGGSKTRQTVSKAFNPAADGSHIVTVLADESDVNCSTFDHDGDGVADIIDLDDDNDGILDIDEACSDVTYVSGIWSSNTYVLADNDVAFNPTYIASISDPGTFGSGIDAVNTEVGGSDDFPEDISSATGTSMAIYGVDQNSLTSAIINGDYFEMEFTTAASWSGSLELANLRYAQYYLQGTSTEIGGQYSYGLHISDDNFSSSTQLKGAGIIGRPGSDPESYSSTFNGADFYFYHVNFSYALSPSTTYKIRFYLFGDSDGKVNLDDISFDVQHCTDFDSDGIPDYLDLDSDNDGIPDIVEASGTDSNGDGKVDTGTDTDGDGLVDTYDNDDTDGPDVAACSIGVDCNLSASTTLLLDTNADGTNDNNRDHDTDGYPNYIDIDADNDGIVDNTEAQSTVGYVAPTGNDTDADGIDDAYDVDCTPCGATTGTTVSPVNTDGDSFADYLDADSDDDGINDVIEGHDTDGNGTVDGSDSPDANTGLPGGSTDADGDGLLDGFDNNIISWDETNNNLNPNSHPDAQGVTSERDWREDASLPVEWMSFTVTQQGSDASLHWSTASEMNAKFYEIQRSSNGEVFEKIGMKQAVGTTQELSRYYFRDQEISGKFQANLFYRLKQVDLNGSFEFSKVIELNLNQEKQVAKIKVSPIPAQDFIQVSYTQATAKALPLKIYASNGQRMYSGEINQIEGSFRVAVKDWPRGAYFLKVEDDRNIVVRFMVMYQ